MKKKIYTLKYRRYTIRLDFNPRKGICQCCGKKGLTNMHHWKYEFTTKAVKEDNSLALKNVSELCFVCHNLANDAKHILDDFCRYLKLLDLVPEDMKRPRSCIGIKEV